MSDISTTSWSELDASNSQVPPEGWPAGMAANAVEPSARMNMGAVKRHWNRINPVYAATQSTADSYVVTPTQAIAGYGLYELWRVRMGIANASTSPTLAISGFPPQPVKKYSGSSITALSAGDIRAKDHAFWWDGIEFILVDPFSNANGTVTSIDAVSDTSSGILASGGPVTGAGAFNFRIDPTRTPTKATLTSQDSFLIGDAAAGTAVKRAVMAALFNSDTNVGYQNIPQNSKSANYTTVAADAGKHIYHPAADSTSRTWTIDANVTVPYPIGTAITFVNDGGGALSITTATSDTIVLGSSGATGTRTLASNGVATALKVTATRWVITGTGLT